MWNRCLCRPILPWVLHGSEAVMGLIAKAGAVLADRHDRLKHRVPARMPFDFRYKAVVVGQRGWLEGQTSREATSSLPTYTLSFPCNL